ncbi:MAG: DUF1127 domain-containing protein [Amaricoccus sp.]
MANVATLEGRLGEANGLWGRIRKALDDYRLYRSTVEELDALNDRELADLGISRLSIRDIALDSVYRR